VAAAVRHPISRSSWTVSKLAAAVRGVPSPHYPNLKPFFGIPSNDRF